MIRWAACPHWWMGTKWLLNLFQLLFFLHAPELWPIVSLRQHTTCLKYPLASRQTFFDVLSNQVTFPLCFPTPLLSSLVSCKCAKLLQSCPTFWDSKGCGLPGSSVPGGSPGKNTEVGCHALLQGIFPTQGSSPGPPHCRQILYCLNHQRSPYSQPAETLSNLPKVATLITKEM